jgi:hypothetical protein
MASQSTSISDLQRTDTNSNEDIQESMMVNSILQDIENDEDLNDVNEESLQYTIDTSQIPPKIGTELPTREEIQETTNNIFNDDFPIPNDFNQPEPTETKTNDIDDFLNSKLDKVEENEKEKEEEDKTLLDTIQDLIPIMIFIMITFFILSLPQLNRLIVRCIPKLSSDGNISILCIIIKALILGIIYLLSSLFL